MKLCLDKRNKFLKNREHVNFRTKKVDPSKMTIIIDKCHKIMILTMRNNRTDTPNISMHNLKTSEARVPCIGKGNVLLLPRRQVTQLKEAGDEEKEFLMPK